MSADKVNQIITDVEGLSVLELSQLVKALEEKFGVTAAAPVAAVAAAPTAGAAAGEPAEEQTSFNVVIADAGANKIAVIKALREINPNLGLKEAKDLSEKPGAVILEGANKANATEAKDKLTAAGAKVELK
jgi:large subunit ribosomal protein L7/L12